jgi:hemoglobin
VNKEAIKSVMLSMNLLDTHVYGLIGDDGFRRLVAAFYRRVLTNHILGPMYEGRDLAAAEWRLREFLVGRFGGPDRYVQKRGHPRLRMRHHPFAIDRAARDQWVALMLTAMQEAELPGEAVPLLNKFFAEAATFLINRA